MELEFCKHFKDASNLLLMMDHDSGYVEGAESCTSSSNESHSQHKVVGVKTCEESDNFLLSEDALLEKPDISFKFGENLPYEIDTKDYEETRKLFFSPDYIRGSVSSQSSTLLYSALKTEAFSDGSAEIPLQSPIVIENKKIIKMDDNGTDDQDILLISASESDMSLEQTFDSVIIENGSVCSLQKCNLGNSLKKLSKNEVNLGESVHREATSEKATSTFSEHSPKEALEKTKNDSLKTPNITEPDDLNSDIEGTESMNDTSATEIANNCLNIYPNTSEVSKDKPKLTLVFSKCETENGYSVKRKYPSMTPDKQNQNTVDPNISPDIFDDEMIDNKLSYFEVPIKDSIAAPLTQALSEEKYVDKLDQKLLKRTQMGISGVLPPPSVTVIHMSVHDILTKLGENKCYSFWNANSSNKQEEKDSIEKSREKLDTSLNSSTESNSLSRSLLLSVDLVEAQNSNWPDAYNMRCHGLHYNCGKISEEIVDLSDKYQKRFVGAETQSTCTVFETQNMTSPFKRKNTKSRWGGKSPGRRLSHLARRRITFSSANLQAGGSSLAGSRARQILVDAKKIDMLNRRKSPRKSPRKTPRKTPKKTPSKSPKIKTRTPSSSAKKKLAMRFRKLTGEIEKSLPSTCEISAVHRALFKSPDKGTKSESSKGINKATKRALFQSPIRDTKSSLFTSKSQDLIASGEKNQLRRALFTSPRKNSPLKGKKSPFKQAVLFGYEKKRKRSESDDMHPTKFPRSMSMDVKPSTSNVSKSLSRAQSELNISLNRSQPQNELSEQHKKKLLWAVSGALQSQNITNTHPQWKVFASVLARVTRRFFTIQLAASGAKPEGGTSERMHRIARYHVISVIKGKSADEIISEYVRSRARVQRPQGYVPPEEFTSSRIRAPSGGKENVFQDRVNTIESWEKKKLVQMSKPATAENKIDRIRKVINFGDDR